MAGEDHRIDDIERRVGKLEAGIEAIQGTLGDLRTELAVGFATIRATASVAAEERKTERDKPISLLDMRLRDLLILGAALGLAGADNLIKLLHGIASATGAGGGG